MSTSFAFKLHEIATDGYPDMDKLTGRVAFIFDGCIVSGWPIRTTIEGERLWEADSDVGTHRKLLGVKYWVEFPVPIWDLTT